MTVSKLHIDLRGSIFRVRIKSLKHMYDSLLGRIARILKDYNTHESEHMEEDDDRFRKED